MTAKNANFLTPGFRTSLQVLTPIQNQSSGLGRVRDLDNNHKKSFLPKSPVTTTSSSRTNSHRPDSQVEASWEHQ